MARRGSGDLELLVMLAILRLGEEDAYAVSIVDALREHAGREVKRATVYVTLQRLENKGLISSRLGEPLPQRGGKARRLVRLEAAGLETVRSTRQTYRAMWKGLEPVLEGTK
ncbi:MAG: helix-turn-helix transcriptional regulator [Acidobacteriota bacterium]